MDIIAIVDVRTPRGWEETGCLLTPIKGEAGGTAKVRVQRAGKDGQDLEVEAVHSKVHIPGKWTFFGRGKGDGGRKVT